MGKVKNLFYSGIMGLGLFFGLNKLEAQELFHTSVYADSTAPIVNVAIIPPNPHDTSTFYIRGTAIDVQDGIARIATYFDNNIVDSVETGEYPRNLVIEREVSNLYIKPFNWRTISALSAKFNKGYISVTCCLNLFKTLELFAKSWLRLVILFDNNSVN